MKTLYTVKYKRPYEECFLYFCGEKHGHGSESFSRPIFKSRAPTDEELALRYGVDLNDRIRHRVHPKTGPFSYDVIQWLRAAGTEEEIEEQVGEEIIPAVMPQMWVVTPEFCRLLPAGSYVIVDA